jgi:1-acyl-sn-glycerol-3-phosphate acyltransferase
VAGVRRGCVAVFGSPDPDSGTERLVVLAETREGVERDPDALREAIVGVTVDVLGEPPDEVVLAPPHTVLKTSSGKLRRAASRHLYEAGLTGGKVRGVAWQVVRLLGGSILPQVRRWLGAVAELSFGLYGWAVFWLVALPTWVAVALTPRPDRAWAVCRGAARLLLRVTGTGFRVNGSDNLPQGTPFVLVANHASYLDGLALFAACPTPLSFVAKREFQEDLVARLYLEHLGAHFVERFDVQESVRDANRLAGAAGAGSPLTFFPEGTFRRMAGLQAFHLGAFVAAATAGVPVVPVAIRGTRSMLRDGQRLPRRGVVEVTIGEPIEPPADGADPFAAAVRLRDRTHAEILRHCGEPDAAGSAGAPPPYG